MSKSHIKRPTGNHPTRADAPVRNGARQLLKLQAQAEGSESTQDRALADRTGTPSAGGAVAAAPGPKGKSIASLQRMADNSPVVTRLAKLQRLTATPRRAVAVLQRGKNRGSDGKKGGGFDVDGMRKQILKEQDNRNEFISKAKKKLDVVKDRITPYYISLTQSTHQECEEMQKKAEKLLNNATTEEELKSVYYQLSVPIERYLAVVKQCEKIASMDFSSMNGEKYAEHLAEHATKRKDASAGDLEVIYLYGGGLSAETIEIIEKFYLSNFKLDDTIEQKKKEEILAFLVENAFTERLNKEKANKIKPKDRKVYQKDENDRNSYLKELRESKRLKDAAAKQAAQRNVTPKAGGKLRSWHLNDTGKLPRQILGARGKGDKRAPNIQHGFAEKNARPKGGRNFQGTFGATAREALHKRWDTDIKAKSGFQGGYVSAFPKGEKAFYEKAAHQEPGYVEVNPAGWREALSQGRLLYDYIDDRWFLTTDHYHDVFFEIIVPDQVKRVVADGSAEPAKTGASSVTTTSEGSSNEESRERAYRINNCLLDAIRDSAMLAGHDLKPVTYDQIRDDLQRLGYGNVGTMLYADQRVVERILYHFGLVGVVVILYEQNGRPQELGGGGNNLIHIYHTGALHYVGRPTTAAQKKQQEANLAEKK